MGNTLRDSIPALRQGMGFPSTIRLTNGQVQTAAKVGLDQITISPALKKCSQGYALTVASGTFQIENLGAATAGNYVLGLMRNGVQLGTVTIAYAGGGVSGTTDVDFRNGSLQGIRYAIGDQLRLDLISVPTGVTTGFSIIKANLFCKTHSIDC